MKRCFSFLCIGLFLILSGCGAPTVGDVGAVRQLFAMDTLMQITLYGAYQEEAAEAATAEINRLERLLSRTRSDSQISALNAHAGDGVSIPLDPATFELLSLAQDCTKETDHAFDMTIAPLMDAWGFGGQQYQVPSREELQSLLLLVDGEKLLLDPETSTGRLADPGMSIDLGAIAKGYTARRLLALLASYEIDSAKLELGGNITALGTRYDGQPWRIAVRDPKAADSYLCVLPLVDATASTSGGYERYFEQDGVTYHHIIDPATGFPADSGVLSVTVISADAVQNDAFSTALFIMGADQAVAFWQEHEGFEFILAKADGTVLVTEGLEEDLEFRGAENGYTCEIVRR